MGDIIEFPVKKQPPKPLVIKQRPKAKIKEVFVDEPRDRYEYLALVKKYLSFDCYKQILCGIMDKECYDDLHPKLKAIVDSFHTFEITK